MKRLFFVLLLLISNPSFASADIDSVQVKDGPVEKVTFDIGMAAGTRASRTYTEFNLGMSVYFDEYFLWRNAFFSHMQSETDTFFGIDSSARWILPFRKGDSGFAVFAGPGIRLPFRGEFSPSLEGGLWLKQGALSFGAGAKSIMNSIVRSHQEDDTQFLILLGLGPTL